MAAITVAIPDLISNSYFPLVAAVDLGCFTAQGVEAELELIYPVTACYEKLRDGAIHFVGGAAHAALSAFPDWQGGKLLGAQGQHMYWFLVMRPDLVRDRGDLSTLKGVRIAAAPWVDMGLRQTLIAGGVDLAGDDVQIVPVPGLIPGNVNFGVMAAQALADGKVDGFWANGMGTEVAVTEGFGRVLLDVRRGDGPAEARDLTFSALATSEALIAEQPDLARAAVEALRQAHSLLREDPDRATAIAAKRFPEREAALIAELIRRDLPYYETDIPDAAIAGLNHFARAEGLAARDFTRPEMVAAL